MVILSADRHEIPLKWFCIDFVEFELKTISTSIYWLVLAGIGAYKQSMGSINELIGKIMVANYRTTQIIFP